MPRTDQHHLDDLRCPPGGDFGEVGLGVWFCSFVFGHLASAQGKSKRPNNGSFSVCFPERQPLGITLVTMQQKALTARHLQFPESSIPFGNLLKGGVNHHGQVQVSRLCRADA